MAKVEIRVNGVKQSRNVEDRTLLANFLRDELGLTGTHIGCDTSQCGCCTVHLNGAPVRSCSVPVSSVAGQAITTLAGLGTPEHPHPLQQAFIDEQVPQCGYCMSGWIMTAAAFLENSPTPSDQEIRAALSGLKCRCGVHMAIMRAVKRAAASMQANRGRSS